MLTNILQIILLKTSFKIWAAWPYNYAISVFGKV